MAELRTDPITGVRSLIGAAAARAGDVDSTSTPRPAPVLVPAAPALRPDAPAPAAEANRDLFTALAATGAHERIPAGPGVDSLATLELGAVIAFVEQWRERMRAHGEAPSLHLVLDDPPGGADLYADLFAFDFVPAALARERERFGAYATRTMGGNLLADIVQEEVRRRERVVAIDPEAVLISPYGARVPYQLMVAPRRPRARFEADGPSGAAMLHDAVRRLAARFGSAPALTAWVRTAPRGAEQYAWRIDVLPRLGEPGGLELGTGVPFNPVAPEQAAAELRDVGA